MTGIEPGGFGEQFQRARLESMRPQGPGKGEGLPLQQPDGAAGSTFSSALENAIDNVDGMSKDVGKKVQSLASGEPVALHDIMMAMGKSEVSFNLMLEVRNKMVEAWEKLSRSVV